MLEVFCKDNLSLYKLL